LRMHTCRKDKAQYIKCYMDLVVGHSVLPATRPWCAVTSCTSYVKVHRHAGTLTPSLSCMPHSCRLALLSHGPYHRFTLPSHLLFMHAGAVNRL
jgi:hypothetical protein